MTVRPLVLLLLTACAGDQVTTVTLTSGTYDLVDDTAVVTLTVDADALTFTLEEEGGDSIDGTLLLETEGSWAQCCNLNGSGYTQFETYRMDPATFVVGPLDMTAAALNASIAVQEYAAGNDAYDGFAFE